MDFEDYIVEQQNENREVLRRRRAKKTRPVMVTVLLRACSAEDAEHTLTEEGDRKERHLGNMLIPGGIPCSMHGVPERRSNEGGGWGGVTPCVVSPPHRLPTKRATLAPKNDRLLTSRGCHGERHHGPVRLPSLLECYEDACMRPFRHVAERIKQICCLNFQTANEDIPFLNEATNLTEKR